MQMNETVPLVFEDASNPENKYEIFVSSSELIKYSVRNATESLFRTIPSRIALNTKDGQIIQNWINKTVFRIIDNYNTNHFIIGSPDQLG